MKETYLFFDIECANNIKAEGYICSFGYVLCDGDFNIIKKEDLVMNPKAPFDEGLLKPNGPCFLAYTKEYFLSQPDFTFFYDKIKELLTAPDRYSVGFAVENDIDFIICACKHFDLDYIDFESYDSRAMATSLNNVQNSLSGWMTFYKEDVKNLTAHNSCDDAMMTLLLVKNICRQKSISLSDLLLQSKENIRSVKNALETRKMKTYRKYMYSQIESLYNIRCLHAKSRKLKGKFKLALNPQRDLEQIYEINSIVYENGGILVRKIVPGCTFVMEDSREHEEWMEQPRYSSVNFINLNKLFDLLGTAEPEFRYQSHDIPDIEEQIQYYSV